MLSCKNSECRAARVQTSVTLLLDTIQPQPRAYAPTENTAELGALLGESDPCESDRQEA